MPSPHLTVVQSSERIWRVGFKPAPWEWSGWQWATDGRFPGRWDDGEGNFRAIYASSTLVGCLLEVLARFRIDNILQTELEAIVESDDDRTHYRSLGPGRVPYEWLNTRTATSATLSGTYCAVTTADSVAALYPHFIGLALSLGFTDFDAAALKNARPRKLTQTIATYLHDLTNVDGVNFASRHGDNIELWAIFERSGDQPASPLIHDTAEHSLSPDDPKIAEAFNILGLTWAAN